MISFQTGTKLNTDAPEGIWLDYQNHILLFFVKDTVWTQEEIRQVLRSEVTITFIQKGIIDAFLIEIFDCLETSDIPFCVHEASEDFLLSLSDRQDYAWRIIIVDGNNEIKAVRAGAFRHSAALKEALRRRLTQPYDEKLFDQAYEKLAAEYEPFELEQFALFTEKIK